MRVLRTLLKSAGTLLATAAMALAAPLAVLQAQTPPVQVDVHTSESHTVWYTDPLWLAIGGLAVLLVIILLVVAARGRGSNTTVVR